MSRYLKVGDRIGLVVVLELFREGGVRLARCKCDCGRIYQKPTERVKRRRGATEVSCGCLIKELNREKMVAARAKRTWESMVESGRTLRKRSMEDPTQWEIAERCLDIHNEAGRQPPNRLMEILNEFRKKGNGDES